MASYILVQSLKNLYQQTFVPLPDRSELVVGVGRLPRDIKKPRGRQRVLRFTSAGEHVDASVRVSQQSVEEHVLVRLIEITDHLMVPCPVAQCKYWFYNNEQFVSHGQTKHAEVTKTTFKEKSISEILKDAHMDFPLPKQINDDFE
jgi:hypothetical protein